MLWSCLGVVSALYYKYFSCSKAVVEMNLKDAIKLPFHCLRKNEGRRGRAASTHSLVEHRNHSRNMSSHDVFMSFWQKPSTGMAESMRNRNVNICTALR